MVSTEIALDVMPEGAAIVGGRASAFLDVIASEEEDNLVRIKYRRAVFQIEYARDLVLDVAVQQGMAYRSRPGIGMCVHIGAFEGHIVMYRAGSSRVVLCQDVVERCAADILKILLHQVFIAAAAPVRL